MIFTKHKSAVMIFPIVFLSLVFTGCQKTQDEGSQESTETVEVYKQNRLPDELPDELQELIDQGDAQAQTDLGSMYYLGEGVRQDYAKAVEWFEKAANQGNSSAQSNLGLMYYQGLGVSQDYAKAVDLYKKSANQGVAAAQVNLGVMYENGRGVRQDYAKAIDLYEK